MKPALALALAAALFGGCVTIAPPAVAPTAPPVAQLTPAPIITAAPTPAPTPAPVTPAPTPAPITPAPTEAGTPWAVYLAWGADAADDAQREYAVLGNSASLGEMMAEADTAYGMMVDQNRWLDNHPPRACYRVTWDANQKSVHSMMAALDAIRVGDLSEGNRLLDIALLDSKAFTAAIDLATC